MFFGLEERHPAATSGGVEGRHEQPIAPSH
jgi:hypothetical protein